MRHLLRYFTGHAKGLWILFLFMVLAQGCAKYKEFEAIFPATDNSLASYSKIVIDNPQSGDSLHQMLENALKAQLTSIHPGNVKPAKEMNQLENEIALFNYNPKIETLSETKIATLSFSVKANEQVKRDRRVSQVVLKSCNYMTKFPTCLPTGRASLKSGKQEVNIKLTGSISLKNSKGGLIVSEFPFNTSLTDSGRFVNSSGLLLHNGINNIAYEFTKQIMPHREKVKSEILRGGDSVAVKLIENNALNLAINRLDNIVSESSEPDVEDVYNLGLAYEVMGEIAQAVVFYQKANDIDSGEAVVKAALKRVRRIVKD